MKNKLYNILVKYSFIFLAIKLIIALFTSSKAILTPHAHRQIDTLGVSVAYWNKFQQGLTGWDFWLPSVLNARDASGIMAMELPLLNLILAPFMAIPIENKLITLHLVYYVIIFILFLANAKLWKNIKLINIDMYDVMRILPIAGILIGHVAKVIPDIPANIIVLMSMALVLKSEKTKTSIFLLMLGLLIKPTAIISCTILFFDKKNLFSKRTIILLIVSTIPALLFYSLGINWIYEYSKIKSIYSASVGSISYNAVDALYRPKEILRYFNSVFFSRFSLILIIPACIYLVKKKGFSRDIGFVVLGVVLQYLFLALTRGHSVHIHHYYSVGVVPIATVLTFYLMNTVDKRAFTNILLTLLVIRNVEVIVNENKALWKNNKTSYKIRKECLTLKERNSNLPWGKGERFRSNYHIYPILGLCFLEFDSSAEAKYGFSFKNQNIDGCKVIDQTDNLKLYECN